MSLSDSPAIGHANPDQSTPNEETDRIALLGESTSDLKPDSPPVTNLLSSARRSVSIGKFAFLTLVLCGIIGTTAWAVFSPSDSAAKLPPERVTVVTDQLRITDHFESETRFVGQVEAARISRLGLEIAGRLDRVFVDEGQAVGAGEPIARLDTDRLVARRDVLVAKVAAAKAYRDQLVAGPRSETIEQQRQEIARLKSERDRGTLATARQRRLLEKAATSQDEYEQAYYRTKAADAALAAAKARLVELENGTRSEEIAAQEAILQQAEAELAQLDTDLEKSTLTAPYGGAIGQRFVNEGDVLDPGTPVVELLETGQLEVRVGVDSQTARDMETDDGFVLEIDGRSVSASLKSVRRDLDVTSRTADVLFTLTDSNLRPRTGDLATLRVSQRTPQRGAWVPLSALAESSRGLWSLMLVTPDESDDTTGTIERIDVEVLHSEADRVFVTGAITEEQRVVIDGLHRLVPGQIVRVTDREPTP